MTEPNHTREEPRNIIRRRPLSAAEGVVLAFIALIVALLLGQGFLDLAVRGTFHLRESATEANRCKGRARQLVTALQMYIQDYQDQLPPAATWSRELMPYIKQEAVFACPSRPALPAGYAFNGRLSGKRFRQLALPANTPALFESTLGSLNAWGPLESFATPHDGVGYVAYLDGHVSPGRTAPAPR